MITLQRLVAPEPDIPTETALYFRADGAAGHDTNAQRFVLARDATLDFGTYFNLFNLDTWQRGCGLGSLFAEIAGTGRVELTVRCTTPDQGDRIVLSAPVELPPDRPHRVDLSALLGDGAAGLVALRLRALDDGATLSDGRFATQDRPRNLSRLAVSITTFQREAAVRATVARLEAFLERFEQAEHVHVQIVDNGRSAEIAASAHVTTYANPNLGGAGGFARGLIEAEAGGFTHCLFMDDDAAFHMENIARTYAFLALARDPRTAVAGAMIDTMRPWAIWERGARFDGSCHPLHNGVDLRDQDAVAEMEFTPLPEASTTYGGFWFFAFPIGAVRHHPFPFFVRGDDISFSLANRFKIFALNGVVSFQDPFSEKESPQTLYLDLRNHLVHHLVFEDLERSWPGVARIAIRFMLRSMLRFHYDSAEAQLLAWQDVMEGPEIFERHLDMVARRTLIRQMTDAEAWREVTSAPGPERRIFARLPRRVRHYLGLLTLNGHLVPFWSWIGDRKSVDPADRPFVLSAFGAAQVRYRSHAGDRSYTVRHSKARFFGLAWRMAWATLQFRRDFGSLRTRYRQGYAQMTTREYWQRILPRERH